MPRAIVKNLDVCHTLTVRQHQHIFLAKHDRFRIGELCVWHKILFVRGNVPCRTTIKVSADRFHTLCFWSSPTCTRNPSAFVFAVDLPPLSPACCCFWGHSTAQWLSFLHLLQGNFCFARSVPLFVDLLEFIFVEFDFFLSFSCATNTVASTYVYFSAGNSTARSFSMSIFIFFFVGMVFQTVLILSYSLPSVDKNSSSQHKFRQCFYTVLRKFVV
jgi:hypothetical protein